jgi:hypothetical protein
MTRDEITLLVFFQNNYSFKDGNLLDLLDYSFNVGSNHSALFELVNSVITILFFVDLMFPLSTVFTLYVLGSTHLGTT